MCKLEKLEKILQEKQNSNPSVMVYGIYNSGKSMLINALLGKSIAKVGDIPTTDRIDKYEYKGFKIYDTPGIEAPIEHEKITREFLKRIDIVVFVISSDSSFEERKIYEEIKEILKLNKKIILVLNKKSNVENIGVILKKIEKNMMVLGVDINTIEVISVNAKSGLKAKLENKNLLLQKSNILLLEKLLLDVVKKSDIKPTIEFLIKDAVNKEISVLMSKLADENLLKGKIEILKDIENEENILRYELVEYIESKISNIKENIISLLLNNQDISRYLENEIQEIQNFLIEKINTSLDLTYKNLSIKEEKRKKFKIPTEFLKDKKITQPVIKNVLIKLRELKVPGFKGRWEKTLGNWAGKIATGITIAVSFYEIINAYKKEEEEKNAQIQKVLEINSIANEIAFDLSLQLKKTVKEGLSDLYNEIKEPILEDIKSLKDKNANINSQIECLKKLEKELIEKYI